MLNRLYKKVVDNRDQMLSILNDSKFEQILQEAKKSWVAYTPTKNKVSVAGIDSSFNSIKFQGFEFWATSAVSIKPNDDILAELYDVGLSSDEDLSNRSSKMEIAVCEKTVDEVGLVLMDGSLYSQLMTRQSDLSSKITRIMRKKDNVIFVSKTSNTKKQFESLGSFVGDIAYYNHATNRPGFSKIVVEEKFGSDKIISSVFIRLSEDTPIIKLEFLGGQHDTTEIKSAMNDLYQNSVGGYPYALKLAHNKCKISYKKLENMSSVLGLSNEVKSREVLS